MPLGLDINAETSILIQACNRPGVKSLILDVEPYQGFFAGGRSAVQPFMTKLRQGLPSNFHIGMSVDPRAAHYQEIFPDQWLPFIDSIHPQIFWPDFGLSPQDTLAEAYKTWGQSGRPIIPQLSGFNTDPLLMNQARNLALNTYHAAGLSWWELGQIDAAHFAAINYSTTGIVPTSQPSAVSMTTTILNVPYRSNEDPDARKFRNDVGPAVVAMLIDWQRQQKGLSASSIAIDTLSAETSLAQVDTGLSTTAIINLASRNNVSLKLTDNLTLPVITAEIDAGRPCVALIVYADLPGRENQASTGSTFVIVTGYDSSNVYLNDPDWWNSGTYSREEGHNWKVPIAQFEVALQQASVPYQGALIISDSATATPNNPG